MSYDSICGNCSISFSGYELPFDDLIWIESELDECNSTPKVKRESTSASQNMIKQENEEPVRKRKKTAPSDEPKHSHDVEMEALKKKVAEQDLTIARVKVILEVSELKTDALKGKGKNQREERA